MKRFLFVCILFVCYNFSYAQKLNVDKQIDNRQSFTDTSKVSRKSTKTNSDKSKLAKIDEYKIISFQNDTTFVDTTLSIQKEYKYNYLRKDNFNLIAFSNLGQTYNTLSSDFSSIKTIPQFGSRAKHFNYMEIEDVNYFHVPTPLTELFYKTAFEQGQVLDAFFTTNISKQFNFSLAYKGLRSLGKYQHILTSTGNFRFTTNYTTKNSRYKARAHIYMQDILNQENGGLTDEDILNFESGDPEFKDRSVFNPIFEDAENMLKGKRFHLEQRFEIFQKTDSLKNALSVGNTISFEDKYYQFIQTSRNDFFGLSFRNNDLNDKATLENFQSKIDFNYTNKTLGDLEFNINYSNYNYGYNAIVVLQDQTITNRIKGSTISLGGSYKNTIGKFDLIGAFGINITGDFDGNYIDASAGYKINNDILVNGSLNINSTMPNYNYLLYQSDYVNYNWENTNNFTNIKTQQLAFKIESKKFINIGLDYTNIENYAYFKKDSNSSVKPFQHNGSINYLRLKLGKEISYGKFSLDNTIMYQNIVNGEGILNTPKLISRNTLYFTDHLFKKAMFLQTGITLNYFTKYSMDGYDPLLAEFYTQNETKLGAFPRLDFFINAKIRQTRIYLKAEHFNSSFTGYNFYSAPNYPYRDFTVRFGIVWNFFL